MTAVAPDYHQLPMIISSEKTHLVDSITNIIRLGDVPNVESHIPDNQLNPLRFRTSKGTDIRVEMSLDNIKDSNLSLPPRQQLLNDMSP